MKCVPSARRGAASNMAYIRQDLGNLAGPVAAGFVVEALGYRMMWKFMMLPMAVVLALFILLRGEINSIEEDFQARGNN
ncbi:MAG: hypothetical protein LUH07_15110 [Lachnospiraceae bacterium]|nr:hypothetical protein [Lachnospiraceae bacterium]